MNPNRSYLAVLSIASLALGAGAQTRVAICAAATSSSTDCRFTDVQTKLLATGQFAAVDVINAASTTPTLPQLATYDALIVWSNTNFQDAALLGDTLADYVDQGGGVVVATFANSDLSVARALGGRWQTGYEVIPDQLGSTSGSATTLGNVLVPSHPVMTGVATFSGGSSSFRPTTTTLAAGATLIAQWSDGRTLVAEGTNPLRIDLGFYPPSSDCSASFWVSSTDGARLMANALSYVASATTCGAVSYCTGGTTTQGCAPTMSATGTPSAAAASGFTLSCTGLEGQKTGLVFYGVSGRAALPWAAGSTSYLCVQPPTQRTSLQSAGGTLGQCDGALSLDFLAFMTANPAALGQPLSAGQTYDAQTWFRDPPAPKTTNLADAVEFVICP